MLVFGGSCRSSGYRLPLTDCFFTSSPGTQWERRVADHLGDARNTARRVNRRGTTAQKGYGASWQRLSRLARQRQPWCTFCGSTRDLVADHINPAARGRHALTLADVQVLCRRCNGSKGNKAAPKPIQKPRAAFNRQKLT
jgi:5-methylcytosine-specific restriction endonuclease McrA